MFIKNKKLLILSIFLIAILAISAGSATAADIQDDSSNSILMDGDVPTGNGTYVDGPSGPGADPDGDDPGTNPDSPGTGDNPTGNGTYVDGPSGPGADPDGDDPGTDPDGSGAGDNSTDLSGDEPTELLTSNLKITANDITLGQSATITIILTNADGVQIPGKITATVNGKTYTSENGKITQTLTGLAIGTYKITASFAGDNTYNDSSATGTFKVNPTYVSTFAELKNALSNSNVKQIQLTKSIVMSSMITINRDTPIIIDGNKLTLNGNGHGIFKILSTVTIKNLILKGAKATTGAAITSSGKLTINNCQFINNTATGDKVGGAAIYSSGGTLSVSDTKFTSNVANKGKGGAVAVNCNNAVFNKCTFTSNKAKNGDGGAIAAYGKGIKITSCTFKSNSATSTGKSLAGAITLIGTNPNIQSSTFTSNSAKNQAGAILVGKTVSGAVVNKCTFTSNKVIAEDGGAISWSGGKGSITNCKFTSNYAKQDGGCIDFYNNDGKPTPTITIKNCVFNKNKSLKSGAALFLGIKIKFTLSNCNFTSNSKPKYGGAIFFEGASASFSGCNFKSNVASQNGGAISANRGGRMSFSKCTFTSNKAYFGGAILNKAKGITVNNCKFTKNVAGRSGGAIAIQGGTNVIKLTTFLSNKAVYGAGIFQGSKTLTVTKSTFTTNIASKYGGGAFIAGGKFKQSGNKFKGNKGGKKFNVYKK